MKEIDKIAFIEIQQGKILSTKKGKPNIISWRKTGKRRKRRANAYTRNSRGIVTIIPNTAEYIGTFQHNRTEKKKE
jgi:hypothetical protein